MTFSLQSSHWLQPGCYGNNAFARRRATLVACHRAALRNAEITSFRFRFSWTVYSSILSALDGKNGKWTSPDQRGRWDEISLPSTSLAAPLLAKQKLRAVDHRLPRSLLSLVREIPKGGVILTPPTTSRFRLETSGARGLIGRHTDHGLWGEDCKSFMPLPIQGKDKRKQPIMTLRAYTVLHCPTLNIPDIH